MRCKSDKTALALFFALLSVSVIVPLAQAQTSQETIQQYIADLQKSPDDQALREKIIKLAQEAKNPPALPEEARQHLMMAQAFLKKAKNEVGYKLAIDEYKQVLLLAPWLPEAYNNLGVLYEKVGNYDEAASNLKLYLLTNPADAQKAQDMLIEIEATKKLASAEATQQKAQEEKAKSKTIEGVWDNIMWGQRVSGVEPLRISKENGQWVVDDGMGKSFYNSHVVATDTTVSFDRDTYESPELNHVHVDVRLSEDGTKLTGTYTTVDVSSTPQSQTESQEYWRR
jgi:tetratricopeptide (TPR) repeat protein